MLLHYLIILVLLFVIYGSFMLSRKDYRKKDVCPKIIGIPACYLVFIFFVGTLIAHVSDYRFFVPYFLFLAVPFFLALKGTIVELTGTVICPRTPGGTPMCFISLGFCTLLISLKTLSLII